MKEEEIQKLPKVELHCHLDGSLSRDFIQQKLHRNVAKEELCVSMECESLVEYLEKFQLPGACIMDEEGLYQAGYDVLESMKKENVCYGEIRFAPLLSVTETMDTSHVIQALLRGLEQGKKDFHVEYNVLTCAMRHHSYEENYQMIKVAREFLGQGVCGADLAGAEAQYPMSEFMELFRKVKALDMPFTIHAGECGNAQNIVDAIEAGATRVGHGIAMRENESVMQMVKNRHIGVEMCPISNLQTKAVESTKDYPIKDYLKRGILVSLNTDNRTVSDTTLTKEMMFVQKTYGISDEELIQMQKNAIETSFAAEEIKDKLYRKLS